MALTDEQRAKLNARASQSKQNDMNAEYDEYQEFLRFKEMKERQRQQEQYQMFQQSQQQQFQQNTFEQPVQNNSPKKTNSYDDLPLGKKIVGWCIFLVVALVYMGARGRLHRNATVQNEPAEQVSQEAQVEENREISNTVEEKPEQVVEEVHEEPVQEQDQVREEEPAEQKAAVAADNSAMTMDEWEFKNSCQEFNYKQIARNPDAYVGQHFKVDVQIFNTDNGGIFSGYDKCYKAFTKMDSEYLSDVYMGDMIFLLDEMDTQSPSYFKVLDEDIITAYCTFEGMVETW